ncbi:MAG: T9SS type A sorting domain-containing protein [Bacteroidia bacterium]|nr:T9SS type A sorting domain-containing protein [Bacteroidia bacterium]
MKKITITLAAAVLVGMSASAQCAKYVLMEQFTQASCGPCASQNPGFKTTVLDPNPQKVRHIAYHTSWPGVDPMYNANTTDNGGRTTYYSVTGVPHIKLLGSKKAGAPSGFTQSDVDYFWSEGSPLKITVSEVDNGSTRTVTATIKTIGTQPAGSYNILGAIIERNRTYGTPPGSNGETYFPNVFLDMLQPTTNGQAFTIPTQGNSTTWGPFTYNESLAQNASELGVVVFIQNNSTKEVIQSGATFDQVIDAVMFSPSQLVQQGMSSSLSTFSFQTGNSGNASGQFNYTLTSTAPGGWTSGFTVNSTNYTTTATVNIPANTNYATSINVTPNATPGVGKYTLSMTSVANPQAPAMTMTVYVISGVTDLVVNNTSGLGTGSGTPSQFEGQYTAGLVYAGNTAYAITDINVLVRAIQDGAMGGVKNVYMNMAWSFPSLTDAFCNAMTTFLSTSGKCMFICGQDIAWETMDAASTYDTPTTQSFFTNYMNASYVADGSTANTQLTANTGDAIFGGMGNHALTTATYTSTNYFPDEINAVGNGLVISYYNGNTAKKSGVRATNGTYKVVYLGVGIEQFGTTNSKNTILKLSHDWFWGLTTTEEFDNAMIAISLGQNYPNPANTTTVIPFENLDRNGTLEVLDLAGRVVYSQSVSANATYVNLNVEKLESGTYIYRLVADGKIIASKPMNVVH